MVRAEDRNIVPLTLEEFCIADDNGDWVERVEVNGFTILLFDRASLVCDVTGNCFMGVQKGTNMQPFITPYDDVKCEAA